MIEILPNWHPVLVHFTIAPIGLSVAGFVLAQLLAPGAIRTRLLIVAEWNFFIGAAFSLATVLAGWHAYQTVPHDAPAHVAMNVHRAWALTSLAVILALAFWRGWRLWQGRPASRLFVLALLVCGLLVATTAWHGGELVYRHGLGVRSLPAVENYEHTH